MAKVAQPEPVKQEPVITMWSKEFTYDRWMKTKGIPIHTGYFIPDLRTIDLEWWEERGCKAAFIQLLGQEGVSASRVTEIPAGKSLPPVKFALDELVYVLSGRGLTTVSFAGTTYDVGAITTMFSVTCKVTSRSGCSTTATCPWRCPRYRNLTCILITPTNRKMA